MEESKRIVLTDDKGRREVFDVTIDFQAVAFELQARARENRSYCAVVAGGAVKVEFKPWLVSGGAHSAVEAPKHAYQRNCDCPACNKEWTRRSAPIEHPRPASNMRNCSHGVPAGGDCRECRADGIA